MPRARPSEKKLREFAALFNKYGNAGAAKRLKIPQNTASMWRRYAEDLGIECEAPEVSIEALEQARERDVEAVIQDLKRRNKDLVHQLRQEMMVREAIQEIDGHWRPKIVRAGKKTGTPPIVICSNHSDLHVEEIVEPKKINGLNEHNLQIADEKLHLMWQNTVRVHKRMGTGNDVRAHLLWLGGDLFTGHLHPDNVETVALPPVQAAFWLLERFAGGIRYVLSQIDCPLIVVCSFGNHGRLTEKTRVATVQEHSLEWIIYRCLAREFKDTPGIEFRIADGHHSYVDLEGFTLRYTHGDAIRYGGGVGGLTIPANKAIGKWNEAKYADLTVFGHFHQTIDQSLFVCNGSLIGYSSYSEWVKGSFELPQQSAFAVDLRYGQKTVFQPIFVLPPAIAQRYLKRRK
jgi:hypothetical protein